MSDKQNQQKMNDNRMSILNLNEDCQLEIMKYIIADCELGDKSQGNLRNYADLVNFALAHEEFEAILVEYYRDLYKSLKFVFVANRETLEIDFSELQSTHTGKGGNAFWRIYADAIRENNVLSKVLLNYAPESFQPDFLDHFEIIKHALENKKSLKDVTIELNGYSLENLNNFGNITKLDLEVRMSAEALVTVCKSNPHLDSLCFLSTDILGRLSDIAPYCRNLRYLEFMPKPDTDGAEYAPLAELPNLKEMTIYSAFENGSLLNIFEAITKWQRPEQLQPLKITFLEFLPHLSKVTIARMNSLLLLELRSAPEGILLSTSYDFWDISRDSSPLEESLATITLTKATLRINYEGLTLHECPTSDTDISEVISILKIFNIKTLILKDKKYKIPIEKLAASMIPDDSYALKSVNTSFTEIDQLGTSELVKIKSITSLTCRLSDWESVDLLSALPNLETLAIKVEKEFKKTNSKALCSLINTCLTSGLIECPDWCIEFKKHENIISHSKITKTLKIKGIHTSHIFEAFNYRDLITIEELDVSECIDINIEDVLKVAEVQPIKKLRISLTNMKDIENLSELTELEELTICDSVEGSLIKLFDQMATKASPSLKSLQINSKCVSSKELVRVSKIGSLKKLDLRYTWPQNYAILMELANSNIEELTLPFPHVSIRKLFSAIAATTTSRLQHLKIMEIPYRYLKLRELEELSKIKSLRSVQCRYLCNNVSYLRNFKHLDKLDIALHVKVRKGLQCLVELENLESLTLFDDDIRQDDNNEDSDDNKHNDHNDDNDNDVDVLQVLTDIQNLKKLNLSVGIGVNLTNVYQAFARKIVKLTHLSATIGCVEELNEITRIKSLKKLQLFVRRIGKNFTSLGELSELESLQITVMDWHDYDDIMAKVLPILKCCKNLDRLLIKSCYYYCNCSKDILKDIHTHLKSVRDPIHQDPLTVIHGTVEDYNDFYKDNNKPEILVVRFENAYFKVLTSSKDYLFR